MAETAAAALAAVLVLAAAAFYSYRRFDAASASHRAAILLFPASQAAAALFVLVSMRQAGLGAPFAFAIALACVACAAADVALCRAMSEAGKRSLDAERSRLLEGQERAEAAYRDEMARIERRASSFRGALLEAIDGIAEGLDQGRDVEGMVDAAAAAVASPGASFCENRAVGALLGGKVAEAERRGLAVAVDVALRGDAPFAATDLCALFANVMDNAIAACERSEAKTLSLKAGPRGAFYAVVAENSCAPDAKLPEADGRARLGEEHGWGLRIIEDVAERYGGVCDVALEDGTFTTTVLLSLRGQK